jgi:hypothetical protein
VTWSWMRSVTWYMTRRTTWNLRGWVTWIRAMRLTWEWTRGETWILTMRTVFVWTLRMTWGLTMGVTWDVRSVRRTINSKRCTTPSRSWVVASWVVVMCRMYICGSSSAWVWTESVEAVTCGWVMIRSINFTCRSRGCDILLAQSNTSYWDWALSFPESLLIS